MTTKNNRTPFFAHEKLDVYVVTLEFLGECDSLYRSWPRGRGDLKNQLSRASDSILLNMAEAAGRRLAGQSGKGFFAVALGSTSECAAILDRLELLRAMDVYTGRRKLRRITAMLYGLTR